MGGEAWGRRVYRAWFAGVLVAAGTAGCSADDELPVAENPCERLREHLVDLRLEGTPPADLASHRDVMRRALGDEFLTSCAGSLSPATSIGWIPIVRSPHPVGRGASVPDHAIGRLTARRGGPMDRASGIRVVAATATRVCVGGCR